MSPSLSPRPRNCLCVCLAPPLNALKLKRIIYHVRCGLVEAAAGCCDGPDHARAAARLLTRLELHLARRRKVQAHSLKCSRKDLILQRARIRAWFEYLPPLDDSRGNSRELPIGAFRFLSARNAHEASALDSIEVMILSTCLASQT